MRNRNHAIQCDIAIIGGGSGGLSLAAGASQLGAKVVLVEMGKMGGDCLNYGCVPSKSLLSAAKAFHHVKTANYFGAQPEKLSLDFNKVMQHVKHIIATIEKNDSVERFESLGVNVILAPGKFIDEKTLQAGDTLIKAKRFVVATGSSAFVPPIAGLDQVHFETNETIFDLNEQPKHLIVIGGGPIGCELAQAFAMLGSRVTILEVFNILPKDDADCVSILREQLEKMGIIIHENINVHQVSLSEAHALVVTIEKDGKTEKITGSHLLVSTGRRANVQGLELEKANVTYSPRGIEVDRRLRSSNKKIYAIGDVAGSFQFTHIANYHAGIVLRNILFRLPAKVDYRAVPWVTYTEPEMAHVGLTAEDTKKRLDVQVIEWPYQENDRAQAEHDIVGKIKVITDNKARILGVTIVGAKAGELILPWVISIREKQTLRTFTDTIVPYPTLSELSKRVAGEFYKPKLFSNKTRWLVKLLLRLR
jgi:pyruvate/2-oxoglutarate dehydrogenase complex dihydrolipoamide dehydrogenase (E3) component